MSKPGALSKKELAEAGRRKLEEFKRKKQLTKGAAECTGAAEPGPAASAAAVPLPVQAPAAAASLPSSIPAVLTAPPAASAAVPASSAPAQPAFEWHGSPGAEATSTAARAAAAGAAAAALEAALMGLPSAAVPAGSPTAVSSSSSAALPAGGLTHSSQLCAASADASTLASHPWGHTQQQQQQQPPALPSPRIPQAWHQPSENTTPVPFQQSAAGGNSIAGLQPHVARSVPVSSPPAADSPAQPGQQQQQQNSSWLSLFGGHSGSAGASGPDQLQPHGQQEQQGRAQQQEGSSDSSRLPHSSSHTSHSASPGHVGLMPPAGVTPQAAATTSTPGKPPMPWMPGEGAAAAAAAATQLPGNNSTAAMSFQQALWSPGLFAGSSSSSSVGASPANLSSAAGAASDSTTAAPTAPKASSSYSSLADSYLTPAAAATATTAASSSADGAGSSSSSKLKLAADVAKPQDSEASSSMLDQNRQQQAEQPGQSSSTPAAGVDQGGVVGIGSQQGQAAAAAGAALANSVWISGAPTAISAFASTAVAQPDSCDPMNSGSNYAALADSYLQRATAAATDAAAAATPPNQPQIPPQQQPQLEQLANGNLSRPTSFSSLTPAAAGVPQENGAVEKQSLSQHGSAIGLAFLGRISSITNSSIPGSGPPSTSGALSVIQAHAESSQRSVERLKLLQQHIDELTQEKLELMRGLQQQARSNEALAEENRVLGEQHNKLAAQLEREQQEVKRVEQEFAAAATSMAALAAERDAHRAAATEAHDRANSLAAENVALENQLLEAKSACLRIEKETSGSSSTIAKLEDKVAKLSATASAAVAELAGMQSERRILKARLMQAEARMRSAGLAPLPPLPSNMGQAEVEVEPPISKVDAEVQADLQPARPRFQLPMDATTLPAEILAVVEGALTAEPTKQLLLDPVKVNHEAAAVLAGLAEWLPKDLVAAAQVAAAAGSPEVRADGSSTTAGDGTAAASGASPADAAVAAAAAAVATLVGADVWCEEARLAGSVVGLAQQLQDSWGSVLDELEHERERNQQLQQEAEELQYQLTELQQQLHQQQHLQPTLQQAHHPHAQQLETDQYHTPVGAHHSNGNELANHEVRLQQQASPRVDEHTEQLPPHQQSEQQHADATPQLPVSVPAHSDAPGTPSHPQHSTGQAGLAAAEAPTVAGVQQDKAYNAADYAAAVNDTSSVMGSVVGSSLSGTTIGRQWDRSSTASSSRTASGGSWFGMFGRKNSNRAQSALV